MHCQILSSGSLGNSLLVRAGELHILVDAGLPLRQLRERFEAAGVAPLAIDHVLITHGHLDHARSAGSLGRRGRAMVHCPEVMMKNRSVNRARRLATLPVGGAGELRGEGEDEEQDVLCFRSVPVPHDCDPTVAFRLEHRDRVMVVVTDMGSPRDEVARALTGAHLLVLEFNYDERMLADGPYPPALKRRVSGDQGHLSNDQAAWMLERIAGDELHTLVLAHLSEKNNTPELALESARATLERKGLGHVRVLVASQHEIGPNLPV